MNFQEVDSEEIGIKSNNDEVPEAISEGKWYETFTLDYLFKKVIEYSLDEEHH